MAVSDGPVLGLEALRARLRAGLVIPAHPLALTADRRFDERRQRALSRYYLAAGAGGLAVAVHTTQFSIRRPDVGLLAPVLEAAADVARETSSTALLISGVVGETQQAVAEARLAADLGYDAVLVSLAGLTLDDDRLAEHCRAISEVLPLIGFYLQEAAGGRPLGIGFWRRFLEIDRVAAIKVAPFDRYRTFDVVRAVAESGRSDEIALYTGNDDAILHDLVSEYAVGDTRVHFAGGLLGQWAVGTRRAVELLERAHQFRRAGAVPIDALVLGQQITDTNAALFDVAHGFAGCIAGIHEVLRHQGLLEGTWCLDPAEGLSPGQEQEISRVLAAYPHLHDDAFVNEHLDEWLR